MGCCVGSQKVEINERNYSPGSSSKELSESPQEQITEEHSNNKDVDSGYGKTKVAYMILCKKNTHTSNAFDLDLSIFLYSISLISMYVLKLIFNYFKRLR